MDTSPVETFIPPSRWNHPPYAWRTLLSNISRILRNHGGLFLLGYKRSLSSLLSLPLTRVKAVVWNPLLSFQLLGLNAILFVQAKIEHKTTPSNEMSLNNSNKNKRRASQSLEDEASPSQTGEQPRKRRATGVKDSPGPLFDDPTSIAASGPASTGYYGEQPPETPSGLPSSSLPPSGLPSLSTPAGIPHGTFVRGLRSIAPALLLPYTAQPPILVAGHTLQELGCAVPTWVVPEEALRRQRCIINEIEYQKSNPPALPPSQIPDLPPKQEIPDYIEFPEGVDEETRRIIEEKNNKIASEAQRIDRERNNMAAKKSRALRIEARDNYRELLIEAKTELKLVRLVLVANGLDPTVWDHLAPNVVLDLMAQTRGEANAVDVRRADVKKREDARRRVERMRARNLVRAQREAEEAAARELARAFPGREDGLDVVRAVSPGLGAAVVEAAGGEYLQVVSPRLSGQQHF